MTEPTITLGGKVLNLRNGLSTEGIPSVTAGIPAVETGGNAAVFSGNPPPEPSLFKRASDLDTSPPAPLLAGRLDHETTLVYGPGGVGKGNLACEYIRRLVDEGHVVLILDYEDHEGEWGRRLDGLGVDLTKVYWFAPLRSGFLGLTDEKSVHVIAEEVKAVGVTYVVIDSVAMACAGGDVMDPATPVVYFAALQRIGLPSLSLAHVSGQTDLSRPFGSVYWHNIPRLTWSLSRRGGEVLLQNRKASNYPTQPTFTVECDYWNDRLVGVTETRADLTLLDRIVEVLEGSGVPMTAKDITDELNAGLPKEEHTDVRTVRRTMGRDAKKPGLSVLRLVPSSSGDLWDKLGDSPEHKEGT